MYKGIGPNKGIEIDEEEAFDYAMEIIATEDDVKEDFKNNFGDEIVEWFYSGNWIREEDEE